MHNNKKYKSQDYVGHLKPGKIKFSIRRIDLHNISVVLANSHKKM